MLTFIDLTKAFDSVHREGHWRILKNIGCPDKFVSIVRSFHDGMLSFIKEKSFYISHGTKQGCVLAPQLFSIFFAMLLLVAFKDRDLGYAVQNQWQRLQTAPSPGNNKWVFCHPSWSPLCWRLCTLPHTESVSQQVFDRFSNAAQGFGLAVSLKKAKVMLQPNRFQVNPKLVPSQP